MSNTTKIMYCTTCAIYLGEQHYLNDGACINPCPDGKFKTINNSVHTCMFCDPNCNTCVTTDTYCTSCGFLGGLQSYMYTDNVCYVTCPTNTYAELSVTGCVDCHVSCSGCFDSKYKCIDCASTYFRVHGSNECSQTCSDGQFADTVTQKCL